MNQNTTTDTVLSPADEHVRKAYDAEDVPVIGHMVSHVPKQPISFLHRVHQQIVAMCR
jgi:hypothetical protein